MNYKELVEKQKEIVEEYMKFNEHLSEEDVLKSHPHLHKYQDNIAISHLRREKTIWINNTFSMASADFTYGVRIGNQFQKKSELVKKLAPIYKVLAPMVEYENDTGVFHIEEYKYAFEIGVTESKSIEIGKLDIASRIKAATAC